MYLMIFLELTKSDQKRTTVRYDSICALEETKKGCIVTLDNGKSIEVLEPYEAVDDAITIISEKISKAESQAYSDEYSSSEANVDNLFIDISGKDKKKK
jgi:hypothetical protein